MTYAYVHARPETTDASGVFYVGKGRDTRSNPRPARNRHHGFVLKKHGADNILVGRLDCSDEQTAFELEKGLIKCLRRMGVALTNMTDGGEGAGGYRHTEEMRAYISETSKARHQDPEYKARHSAGARRAGIKKWQNPEFREKTIAGMTGAKKTLTEDALQSRRENLEKARSPEARAKNAEITRLRWQDPEFRERMAEKRRQSWKDPAKREAMLKGRSEGISKSWQNEETRNKRIRGIKKSSNTSEEGN